MATPVSHVWRPNSCRTVQLDSFIPVPRGATAVAPPPLNWPAKDPADILDYRFDMSPSLLSNDGDTIATLDATVSPSQPGDLTIVSMTADGSKAVFWVTGGQSGTVYTVTISVGTASGRLIQRSVLLPVISLSTVAMPAGAIVTTDGTVLTDQNGNPVLSQS
jgi:hypothetical protein